MAPKKAAGSKASPVRKATTKKAASAKGTNSKKAPAKPTAKSAATKNTAATAKTVKTSMKPGSKEDLSRKLQPGEEGLQTQDAYKGHSIEEILAAIDRRTLTKLDRELIKQIASISSSTTGSSSHVPFLDDRIVFGETPNCHYHIYWLYHHVSDSISPANASERSVAGRSENKISTKTVGRKSSAKKSIEAAHAGNTNTLADAPVLDASERVWPAVASPTSQKSPKSPHRHADSGGKTPRTRKLPTVNSVGYAKGRRSDAKEAELKKVARKARNNHVNQLSQEIYNGSSAAKNGVSLQDFKKAQQDAINDLDRESDRRAKEEGLRKADQSEQGFDVTDAEHGEDDHVGDAQQTTLGQTPRRGTAKSPSKPTASASPAAVERQKAAAKELRERKALVDGEHGFGPDKENRGKEFSTTNPKTILIRDDKGVEHEKVNPFFETMPASEVWHRRMPPYFMFGETKYMEQVLSDQINRDLNRRHDEPAAQPSPSRGIVGKLTDLSTKFFGGSQAPPASTKADEQPAVAQREDFWALPPLATPNAPQKPSAASTSGSIKRKASRSGPTSPAKRARTSRNDHDSTNPLDYEGY